MNKCSICNQPIVLVPSAAERAKKYGGTPEYYTRLFQQHGECVVRKSREEVTSLLRRQYGQPRQHSHA